MAGATRGGPGAGGKNVSASLRQDSGGDGGEEPPQAEVEMRTRSSSLPGLKSSDGKPKKPTLMSSLRRKLQSKSLRRSKPASSLPTHEVPDGGIPSPLQSNGVSLSERKSGGGDLSLVRGLEKSGGDSDRESSVGGAVSASSAPTSVCASHESVSDAGRLDRPPLAGPKPLAAHAQPSQGTVPALPARDSIHAPNSPMSLQELLPERHSHFVSTTVPSTDDSDLHRHTIGLVAAPGFEDNVYENTAALVNAFGPMRDVGRWYSSYHQRRRHSHSGGADQEAGPEERDMLQVPDSVAEGEAEEGIYETVTASDDCAPVVSLSNNVRDLAHFSWYWGPVSRSEAENLLADQKDGTFLVRDSSDDRYLLSLTFRSQGRTLHTRIEHHLGHFSFYAINSGNYDAGFSSVGDLINHSIQESQEGAFCFSRQRFDNAPSIPVRLTAPYSRRNVVRSLQHMCRFVIRQHTRYDLIRELPLPNMVKAYLEQPAVLQ